MDCTIHVAKSKALISFAVTLRLCFRICKKPFFHDEAQIILVAVLCFVKYPCPELECNLGIL